MGAINYSRSRLRKVYTFVGHDKTQSEVKPTIPETFAVFVDDELTVSGSLSDTMSTEGADISFDTTFTSSVSPFAFYMDNTGDLQSHGNVYLVANSVTTSSLALSQSNIIAGTVTGLSAVIV